MFMKMGLSIQERLSENPDTQSIRHTHALCKFNTSSKTEKRSICSPRQSLTNVMARHGQKSARRLEISTSTAEFSKRLADLHPSKEKKYPLRMQFILGMTHHPLAWMILLKIWRNTSCEVQISSYFKPFNDSFKVSSAMRWA